MLTFGPISSLFDFLTFGLMLGVLHAGAPEFRTGWFVESLATQTLIIFAIRTARILFFRSRPGGADGGDACGHRRRRRADRFALAWTAFRRCRGSSSGRWPFFVVAHLVLVEINKAVFYAEPVRSPGPPHRTRARTHRIHRRAARFSHLGLR